MTTTSYDPFDPDAWSGTPGCEAFEIALDMRAQGALAPAAVPVLEAHLGSCDSCRAHAASQARVATALSAATPAPPDWDAVHAKVQASVKRAPRVAIVFAGLLLSGVGVAWGSHRLFGAPALPLAVAAYLAGSALFLLGLAYWAPRRRLRALLATGDIVAAYRREIETAIKRLERGRLSGRVGLVILAGHLVSRFAPGVEHRPGARASMAMMVLVLATMMFTRVYYPIRARALRRELAELK